MNKIKENRKIFFTSAAVTLFFLLRSLLLTDRNYLGFENLYTMETDFSGENITLIILLVVFAVLAGLIILQTGKRFGETATFLSVLLVAEPLFFAKQMNCVTVFIANLALLFILNALCEKKIIPNEATLIVFLIVSSVLSENAIFLYALPAMILYFVGDGENLFRSAKKIAVTVLSVISVAAGMLMHNYLVKEYPSFESFIKTYTFFKQVYFKHIAYENILLFVFVIPTIALGGYFLVEFIKNCDKKRNNNPSYVTAFMISAAYILSITGFILKGSDGFFTINYIVPLSIFTLLANENKEAEKSLETVNGFLSKHRLAFVVAAVFLCFASTLVFYKDTDNLAGFILNI